MDTQNAQGLKAAFRDPPGEYSAAPFWFLNDGLQPDDLRTQLRRMRQQGIYECVAHPRKGLSVPYLSEAWFERIGVILDEARCLGMRVWLYDEQDWPSGYAGGRVIAENPDFAAQCLSVEKIIPVMGKPIEVRDIPGKKLVRVIASHSNREFYDITENPGWSSQTLCWEVFVLRSERCDHCPAYSDLPYVDLLNREAVQTFIRLTHAQYKRRFPEHWGTTIKGFFTDEPGFYQNYIYQTRNLNTVPWTDELPAYFQKQCGYDLMLYIGALWDDMGALSRKVRQDYYRVLTQLYNESFFRQLHDFCDADGLQSIGHLHMEEHLSDTVQMEGSFLADMRYLHVPGIDRINRQRPRVTEKLGSSAMHLYGRKRCFSESYGCFGWGLTLQEMKAEADWQLVQGINMLVPHAFFSSIEGFRKDESPPSLFFQNPYWPHFAAYADYVRRLSYVLSSGDFMADVLVYYPITSCYEQFTPLAHYGVDKLDEQLIALCDGLQQSQVDFDFADDEALSERTQLCGARLHIGETAYRCVILPPVCNLPLQTLALLERFAAAGGTVVCTGAVPVPAAMPDDDAQAALLWQRLLQAPGCLHCRLTQVPALCRERGFSPLRLHRPDGSIKYMHRRLADAEVYFIINESAAPAQHVLTVQGSGAVERLDPESGEAVPVAAMEDDGELTLCLPLEGYGSCLLLITRPQPAQELTQWTVTLPDGTRRTDALGDWASLGLADYSGTLTYETVFQAQPGRPLTLELGRCHDVAVVTVNGTALPACCWQPYRFDLTPQLRPGTNTLQVQVCNTLANRLTQDKAPSGLYGPVLLK